MAIDIIKLKMLVGDIKDLYIPEIKNQDYLFLAGLHQLLNRYKSDKTIYDYKIQKCEMPIVLVDVLMAPLLKSYEIGINFEKDAK